MHYPAGGPYTHHFTPVTCPSIGPSTDEESDGISAKLAADGRTLWAQKFGDPATLYTRGFSSLTNAERAQLRAFKDAALGSAFDFTDGSFGPVSGTQKVKFAPAGYVLKWGLKSGQRQGTTLVMVEAD